MTLALRVVLLIVSILNCVWIILRIRKAQAKIEDSVFWILFSGLLVCMSIFPQAVSWGAAVIGVQSPVNFVFLTIIFVLILKLFRLSIKLSQIESKLQSFVQSYAIDKFKMREDRMNKERQIKSENECSTGGGALIIVPAYNEQDNIIRTIEDIKQNTPDTDYIVINDCSSDDTRTILRKKHANYLDVPVNLGIGGGVQTGYRYALEHGYDIAIQFDGDGQHDAQYISDLIAPIKGGQADMVIGSRFITNEGFQSSAMRRLGINFLSKLIHLLCGVKVKDVTSGMRAVNRKILEEFSENYAQDYPEPEAILVSGLMGARIQEVPVQMRERQGGTSSINALRSVYYMIKVSLALVMTRLTAGRGRR